MHELSCMGMQTSPANLMFNNLSNVNSPSMHPPTTLRELTFEEIELIYGAWDWSDFAGSVVVGGVAGAAGGAAAGAIAGGVGAGPGAVAGGVGGAVGGGVAYAGSQAWDYFFG